MRRREVLSKQVDGGRSGSAAMQRREVLSKQVDGGRSGSAAMQRREVLSKQADNSRSGKCGEAEEGRRRDNPGGASRGRRRRSGALVAGFQWKGGMWVLADRKLR